MLDGELFWVCIEENGFYFGEKDYFGLVSSLLFFFSFFKPIFCFSFSSLLPFLLHPFLLLPFFHQPFVLFLNLYFFILSLILEFSSVHLVRSWHKDSVNVLLLSLNSLSLKYVNSSCALGIS